MKNKLMGVVALLLCFMLVLSACSGGNGKQENGGQNEGGTKPQAKVEELTLAFPFVGAIPKDMQLIEDAINEISVAKIGAKVKFLPISVSEWQQQTNLMFTSNEKLDLFLIFGTTYSNMIAKGQLVPLDTLIKEHGEGITAALGEEYLQAAKVKGKVYGVPTVRDLATSYGLTMRKDLVEKYGIDLASIKTLDDVEGMLKIVKNGDSNFTPLIPGAIGRSFRDDYVFFDELSDSLGVLPNYDNDLKVVNLYETKEYADLIQKTRKWYLDGYILKDAATNKSSQFDLIKSDKGFAYLAKQKPGFASGETQASGIEMVTAELLEPVATTSTVTSAMWGIPVHSELPEKAMAFMNLMFTDKDIVNLFDWGIEGKHYVKVEGTDNVIAYPSGLNSTTTTYNMPLGWMFGNQFLSYVLEGNDPDIWAKTDAFNKNAKRSKALGFMFDVSPVKTEYAAVTNVITQYKLPLETGSVDPANILPEFISKLKSAGIDKIIEEKQRQLDAWAQENGVK
jgi:putative aldouronate transport system substrate-binding protein